MRAGHNARVTNAKRGGPERALGGDARGPDGVDVMLTPREQARLPPPQSFDSAGGPDARVPQGTSRAFARQAAAVKRGAEAGARA